MGAVIPLVALKDEIVNRNWPVDFLWVGTEDGVEREVLAQDFNYVGIKSGKLRRYFSLQNFIDPFRLVYAFFQSWALLRKFKPNLIVSAGGYVSVPLVLAGAALGIKSIIHQQDLQVGLANRIMAKVASKVTVAFESLATQFDAKKVVVVGNLVRPGLLLGNKEQGLAKFKLVKDVPVLVVMGGSLGAEKINELIFSAVSSLIETCQIIHIVGRGNAVQWVDKEKFGERSNRYQSYEYVDKDMADLYAVADLIVCRAGLSTLTEITALKKAAIVIPIPKNQQEANADYFAKNNAIIRLNQETLTAQELIETIQGLFYSGSSLDNLRRNIASVMLPEANNSFIKVLEALIPFK